MRRFDIIAEICDAALALGWGAYQNDREDANGQFEINWMYADALVTADRHAFFKYMVKQFGSPLRDGLNFDWLMELQIPISCLRH